MQEFVVLIQILQILQWPQKITSQPCQLVCNVFLITSDLHHQQTVWSFFRSRYAEGE